MSLVRIVGALAFATALLCWPSPSAEAQYRIADGITEYDLKTAYLYNFTRYFTWPKTAFEDKNSPFIIGVLGNDPMGTALDEVARRKTARGRRIVIRRFASWKDYRPCHILFLPRTLPRTIHAKVIEQTRQAPLLLIGETPRFAKRGGTVNFYPDVNGTIGFEINVAAAAERKLSVDARLLKLAKVIKSSSQSGG